MKIIRIQSPDDVIANWTVFKTGLSEICKLTGERLSEEEYFKMLINLSTRNDDAWIGIAMEGGPLSFAVACDSTLPFCKHRTFTCLSFYAVPGRPDSTESLQAAFEEFAKKNDVKSYVVTTRRRSTAAMRCFTSRSARYGFKYGYQTFEKFIT